MQPETQRHGMRRLSSWSSMRVQVWFALKGPGIAGNLIRLLTNPSGARCVASVRSAAALRDSVLTCRPTFIRSTELLVNNPASSSSPLPTAPRWPSGTAHIGTHPHAHPCICTANCAPRICKGIVIIIELARGESSNTANNYQSSTIVDVSMSAMSVSWTCF